MPQAKDSQKVLTDEVSAVKTAHAAAGANRMKEAQDGARTDSIPIAYDYLRTSSAASESSEPLLSSPVASQMARSLSAPAGGGMATGDCRLRG